MSPDEKASVRYLVTRNITLCHCAVTHLDPGECRVSGTIFTQRVLKNHIEEKLNTEPAFNSYFTGHFKANY